MPIKPRTFRTTFGAGNFLIVFTFFGSSVTPCSLMLKPGCSVCFLKNLHFFNVSFGPYVLRQLYTYWTWLRRSSGVSEKMRMSPRYAIADHSCLWKKNVYKFLEDCWCITQLNWHPFKLKQSLMTCKHCFPYLSVLILHANIHSLSLVQWSTQLYRANIWYQQSTVMDMILILLSLV